MSAEDLAIAIKGKPEGLNCKTAHELLFVVNTRFQSINSFRQCMNTSEEHFEKIKQSPIILLDPAKVISHHKFKYALEQCPKSLVNPKQTYKR